MEQVSFTFALTVFTGFFAVMNPIANTPIFLGLVGEMDKQARKKVARNATITALVIELSFIILGKYIFQLFGISIPAFKLTGGILLFYIGFEMLQSKTSSIHSNQDIEKEMDSIAVSPLAIPILAGPGTIVTGMNFVQGGNYFQMFTVILIFGLMIFLTYLAFVLSEKIVDKIGSNLIAVIGKIMGLIIAIIGTDMAINGIKLAFNL